MSSTAKGGGGTTNLIGSSLLVVFGEQLSILAVEPILLFDGNLLKLPDFFRVSDMSILP